MISTKIANNCKKILPRIASFDGAFMLDSLMRLCSLISLDTLSRTIFITFLCLSWANWFRTISIMHDAGFISWKFWCIIYNFPFKTLWIASKLIHWCHFVRSWIIQMWSWILWNMRNFARHQCNWNFSQFFEAFWNQERILLDDFKMSISEKNEKRVRIAIEEDEYEVGN